MLTAHPDVAIPPESRFLRRLETWWAQCTKAGGFDPIVATKAIDRHLERMGIPRDRVLNRLSELTDPSPEQAVDAIFGVYAESEGKPRWGDKTPENVERLSMLGRLLPAARFVHIVRDGRDVVLSQLQQAFGPKSIWGCAHQWRRLVSLGRRTGNDLGPGRYYELRYEDLVVSPEVELRSLCAFLGLEFDPRMISFNRDARQKLPDVERRHHAHIHLSLQNSLRDWRTQMNPRDVELFEVVGGGLLSEIGYERAFPRPSVAARMKSLAIGARELAGETGMRTLRRRGRALRRHGVLAIEGRPKRR